jgi:hypothetical protein
VVAINLTGIWLCMKFELEQMVSRQGGVIVNTSSGAGLRGLPYQCAYSANWEINEAFAAQIIGCNRELKIPLDKMNINGGGISLGHPVGMTGARLIVSLIHEMRRRNVRYGGASLCGGGGPSTSMIVELMPY